MRSTSLSPLVSVTGLFVMGAFACNSESMRSEKTKPVTEGPAHSPAATAEEPAPAAIGRSDLSPEEINEKCQSICEKTAAMPCVTASTCIAGCVETYSMPVCRAEFGAMLTCAATTPADGFVCDAPGAPSLKDGECEAEQDRAAGCLERAMRTSDAVAPNQ